VPTAAGVISLPGEVGLAAPHWKDEARAISADVDRHDAGATGEGRARAITLHVRDVFVAMEQDTGLRLDVLSVDGAATGNDPQQMQADVLDRPVQRKMVASSARGGGDHGRRRDFRCGTMPDRKPCVCAPTHPPSMDAMQRDVLIAGWSKALDLAIGR